MKTIEDYKKEYKEAKIQSQKLSSKMIKLRNKINKFKVSDEKELVSKIPFDDIDKISDEQWQWLLYNWHDETTYGYQTRTNFFYNMLLSPNGIAGHDMVDSIRQFSFTLHDHMDVDVFFTKFNIILPHLKTFKSKYADFDIVDVQLFINVYGWNWEYDGVYLEIDKEKNIGRFVCHYNDNMGDWLSLDVCKDKLKEYKNQ